MSPVSQNLFKVFFAAATGAMVGNLLILEIAFRWFLNYRRVTGSSPPNSRRMYPDEA